MENEKIKILLAKTTAILALFCVRTSKQKDMLQALR